MKATSIILSFVKFTAVAYTAFTITCGLMQVMNFITDPSPTTVDNLWFWKAFGISLLIFICTICVCGLTYAIAAFLEDD